MLLAAAITTAMLMTAVGHADDDPSGPRSTARTVALHWAATVPAPARLGVEPSARCRRLARDRAACPIAIVVLARDATGRRPWRCSATVLVGRRGGTLAGQRTDTRCARFPAPGLPDPAAAIGTAVALEANGDVACLPADDGRATCVMSFGGCVRAASVPLSRPARSVAIGAPLCAQRRASSSA